MGASVIRKTRKQNSITGDRKEFSSVQHGVLDRVNRRPQGNCTGTESTCDSPPVAIVSHDVMSDLPIWSNELPDFKSVPFRKQFRLRPVLRHRTSLIQEQPDERFHDIWGQATSLFPNWPSFFDGRYRPDSELLTKLEELKHRASCS